MDGITTFYLFYFEDESHISIPRLPSVDMGNMRGMSGCLSIFSYPSNHVRKHNEF